MLETNKIYEGNSLEVLKTFLDESIDMVMTSPPYWGLRDYGVEGQLGQEQTFQEYISKLCDIFDEIKRVLKKEGTCFVNIGDTYYYPSSNGSNDGRQGFEENAESNFIHSVGNGKCLVCGNPTDRQFCSKKCLNTTSNKFRSQNRLLPNKSLCNIPARFSIEMQNRGWILRNELIWFKKNCMPSSATDRFTVDFEKLFFFTKTQKYYFKTQYEPILLDTINDLNNRKNKARATGEKGSKNNEIDSPRFSEVNGRGRDEFVNAKLGRIKRCVWQINPQPYSEAHSAVFPEKLCQTPIKAGCPENGTVLDPFFGSGTTGLVALKQNKKFVGIELNKEYIYIAEKRLKPFKMQTNLNNFETTQ
jgi:site-specific DNA-methyltransferase (adenine-specific)